MIKSYSDFKAEQSMSSTPLPVGGYVLKIMGAKIESYDWGDCLIVSYDVAEGEFKDYYANKYRADTSDDKKWKGNYRLTIPTDDGSEKDGWSKRNFNNFIWSVEQSNSGYHFDWDETKLKGKLFGGIYRNKEWEYEHKTGWTTECGGVTSVAEIRENKFKPLKDKPLRKSVQAEATFEPIEDGELPF